MSDPAARDAVAVVLGYNHPEDTIECLRSLAASVPQPPALLYVDNGSRLEACQRVVDATPGVRALRLDPNVGVGRGFNAGIADALARGARWVLVVNNDVVVDPGMIRELMSDAAAHPRAGILVPKIYYHAAPDRVWSAGSRYRRFPPVIVMRKTRSTDRGQLDRRRDLEFATLCVAALRREMLGEIGLLDADFHVFQEDYDLCLRARRGVERALRALRPSVAQGVALDARRVAESGVVAALRPQRSAVRPQASGVAVADRMGSSGVRRGADSGRGKGAWSAAVPARIPGRPPRAAAGAATGGRRPRGPSRGPSFVTP